MRWRKHGGGEGFGRVSLPHGLVSDGSDQIIGMGMMVMREWESRGEKVRDQDGASS
jgi:hypothetical protein